MNTAYVTVTVVAIVATGFVAIADLARAGFVLDNSARVGVPQSWLTPLGLAKGAGALGLLLGLAGVPVVGPAAALGLSAFFVGAVLTHLRARNYDLQFPLVFLALAVGSLVLSLAV